MTVVNLAFDVDDVLLDFWSTASPIFNRIFGGNYTKEDFTEFDALTRLYGITYEDFYKTVISEGVLETMKPYDRVPEVIRAYKEKGANIRMITSRSYHPDAYRVTVESFKRYDIPFDDLFIKASGKTKADYIEEPVHTFFDDLPSNIQDVVEGRKAKNIALIRQPWNLNETSFPAYEHIEDVLIPELGTARKHRFPNISTSKMF